MYTPSASTPASAVTSVGREYQPKHSALAAKPVLFLSESVLPATVFSRRAWWSRRRNFGLGFRFLPPDLLDSRLHGTNKDDSRNVDICLSQGYCIELDSALGNNDLFDHPSERDVREWAAHCILDRTATDIGMASSKPDFLHCRKRFRDPRWRPRRLLPLRSESFGVTRNNTIAATNPVLLLCRESPNIDTLSRETELGTWTRSCVLVRLCGLWFGGGVHMNRGFESAPALGGVFRCSMVK